MISINDGLCKLGYTTEMETGRVTGRIWILDRPVKPVETPVKFSSFATKRLISTNRNMHIYFIISETFYKKTVLINHTF